MQYLPEFITVVVIHLLAVMSPGPDFAIVLKNSLLYSRKVALATCLGVALGIGVHVMYSLVGIGYIISRSLLLYSLIKYLGAAYLLYIGIQALRSQKNNSGLGPQATEKTPLTGAQAVRIGFLTNVLNPKATLFFLSLFTQVIHLTTPKTIQLVYGVEMMCMTFVWFGFVATLITHEHIRLQFSSVQHYFEKTFGVILVALGIKVALSK